MLDKLKFKIHTKIREVTEKLNIVFGSAFVIVYSMGKVGSTSTYYSLKKILKSKVLFIHRMSKEEIKSYNLPFIKNNIKPHRSAIGTFARKRLIDRKRPVAMITAIREPIARNISQFFEDFRAYNAGADFKETPIESAINNFMLNFPHDSTEKWLHNELQENTGIRIQELDFNPTIKHTIIEKNSIRLLIYRCDLSRENQTEIIEKFLGINGLNLLVKNAHYQKAYQSYYQDFLKQINLPTEFINNMYSKKYLQTFYSNFEIEQFKKKWTKQ